MRNALRTVSRNVGSCVVLEHSVSRLGGGPGVLSTDGGPIEITADTPLNTAIPTINTGRNTCMNVSDSAIPLPAVALAGRKTCTIQNLSATDTLYWAFSSSVEANRNIGTNAGSEIGPLETLNLNVDATGIIYGIVEAGKTIKIKIFEGAYV